MKFIVRGETITRWEIEVEADNEDAARFEALEKKGDDIQYIGHESRVTSLRTSGELTPDTPHTHDLEVVPAPHGRTGYVARCKHCHSTLRKGGEIKP